MQLIVFGYQKVKGSLLQVRKKDHMQFTDFSLRLKYCQIQSKLTHEIYMTALSKVPNKTQSE